MQSRLRNDRPPTRIHLAAYPADASQRRHDGGSSRRRRCDRLNVSAVSANRENTLAGRKGAIGNCGSATPPYAVSCRPPACSCSPPASPVDCSFSAHGSSTMLAGCPGRPCLPTHLWHHIPKQSLDVSAGWSRCVRSLPTSCPGHRPSNPPGVALGDYDAVTDAAISVSSLAVVGGRVPVRQCDASLQLLCLQCRTGRWR